MALRTTLMLIALAQASGTDCVYASYLNSPKTLKSKNRPLPAKPKGPVVTFRFSRDDARRFPRRRCTIWKRACGSDGCMTYGRGAGHTRFCRFIIFDFLGPGEGSTAG